MPRLADFRSLHPGIDLVIDPTPEMRKLAPDGVDIAIRYGNGDWPGGQAQLLLQSSVVVVASPSLIRPDAVQSVADLAGLPWLQELGTGEATAFLTKYGVERGTCHGLTSLPGNLMLEAARAGQGVAVTARAFVDADVAAGRLNVLVEDDEREGYFLVTQTGVLRPPAKAFALWALRQAQGDPNGFDLRQGPARRTVLAGTGRFCSRPDHRCPPSCSRNSSGGVGGLYPFSRNGNSVRRCRSGICP